MDLWNLYNKKRVDPKRIYTYNSVCRPECLSFFATKPISRVLSCAEIYLGESLPKRSSRHYNTPAEQTLTHCTIRRCIGYGLHVHTVTCMTVSSYLTFPPLPEINLRRYISVALALRSPSAAVGSYPAL